MPQNQTSILRIKMLRRVQLYRKTGIKLRKVSRKGKKDLLNAAGKITRGLKQIYTERVGSINRIIDRKKEERQWRKERECLRELRRTRVKEIKKYKDVRVLDLFDTVCNVTIFPGIGLQLLFPHFKVFSVFLNIFSFGVAVLVIPFSIPYYVYTKYDINRNILSIKRKILQQREYLVENNQRWP